MAVRYMENEFIMDYIRSYVCRDWYCERCGKIEFNVLVEYSAYTMIVVGYCRWNVRCIRYHDLTEFCI